MNKYFRGAAALAVVAAVALTATACSSSSGDKASSSSTSGATQQEISLRLPLLTDISQIGNMVAVQKGFFKAQGLNVTLVPNTDSTTQMQLLGKSLDVAEPVPPQWILAEKQGLHTVAISGLYRYTSSKENAAVLVKSDSPIKSWADLEGKTIGTPSPTGTLMIGLRDKMIEAGADDSTIKPIQANAAQLGDLLAAGRFDAITALQPVLTGLEKKGGYRSLGDPFSALPDNALGGLYVVSPELAKKYPDLAKRWQAAIQAAADWIAKNPTEATAIYVKQSGVPASTMDGVPLSNYSSKLSVADLTAWQNAMIKTKQLPGPVDFKSDIAAK